MKKFLLVTLALMVGGAIWGYADSNLRRGSAQIVVRVVIADEAVAIRVNDPLFLKSLGITHYSEICFKANYNLVSELVFIADFDTVDDVNFGWPLQGTEKECHDWDQSIPVYLWRQNVGADKEVRILFVR